MAEVPEGAELVADGSLMFPAVVVRNIYILPGVPEIFRQKFDALRSGSARRRSTLLSVFVSIGEGTLADHLNALLAGHPDLLLGSYPEFSNPEYKVKVTLESKDRDPRGARRRPSSSRRLPPGALVRVAALARGEPAPPRCYWAWPWSPPRSFFPASAARPSSIPRRASTP